MSARLLSFILAALLFVAGCGTGTNAASHALKTPELPTDKEAKCKVAKSQSEPLIVEWPNAARARLESVSRRGLVAVHYEGCELAVLQRCTVKSTNASYNYSAITRKQSTVVIKDADELYASMPVGAVKLESKLQSAGELDVAMTIVGRYESSSTTVFREELEGECAEATHVIAALTVGSFTFSAGSDAEVGASATAVVGGGGGKSTAKRQTLEHDGDEASCARATTSDKTPPEGCGALLQIEVMPLAKGTKPKPVVAVVPPPPPPPSPPPLGTDDSAALGVGAGTVGVGTVGGLGTRGPPPKCKKGEHAEYGKCVKGPAKKVAATKPAATKPGVKPGVAAAGGIAGSASGLPACQWGQHLEAGHCVEDEKAPEPPPPQPAPTPPPAVVSCIVGSHLEDGACVVDRVDDRKAYVPEYANDPKPQNAGEQPNPWRTVLLYTAVGGGVSASLFGYAALSAAGKVTEGCSEATKSCTQDAADSRSKAKTFALITDVSLGVTLAAVVGIFLLPTRVKIGAAPTPNGVAVTTWGQF